MTNQFTEVGALFEEAQGPFSPDTLPEGSIVYSRRFQRQQEDGNWRLITLWVATVYPNENPFGDTDEPIPGYEVSEQWEEIVCTDPNEPGNTEVDSDYTSDYPYYQLFETVEKANERAKSFITMNHLSNLNYSLR